MRTINRLSLILTEIILLIIDYLAPKDILNIVYIFPALTKVLTKRHIAIHDHSGATILHLLAENGRTGPISQLLAKERTVIDSKDRHGWTPLALAATYGRNGHEGVTKLLLDSRADINLPNKQNRTPLTWAAKKGHAGIVACLLRNNVDVRIRDCYGWSAIFWASMGGNGGIVRMLLEQDPNDDLGDKYGCTPLSWAARRGHEDVVRIFLSRLEVDTRDIYGRTPLSWAAGNGFTSIVKLLLENNALTDLTDNYGQNPLSWAAREGHYTVVELLMRHRDSGYRMAMDNGYKTVASLFERERLVLSTDVHGCTPLERALKNG
ncbi:hypothetical protein AJ79_00724 [Helicocarpus griseus UAMH5409]|uniref:Uncharacterized protein n=1 Tax=Helicocarpus griseus UAMH5409 TaxID=1447875 RepID=A0A2B7Y9B0_9EURO|nr:hypothetical protein AJ79_00724 [Helicocarpus griseus UAMH5409]